MDLVSWFVDYIYQWRKYNYYVSTLTSKYLYHELVGSQWWTPINPHLILGAIPLHNLEHLEILKQEGVNAVVTVLEPFELTPTLYLNPISSADWNVEDIDVLQLTVEDTSGVRLKHIIKAVDFINQHDSDSHLVYVHCKAGKGRSASIVLCYLLYKRYRDTQHVTEQDVDELYKELCQLRPEINISKAQFVPILDYLDYLGVGEPTVPP